MSRKKRKITGGLYLVLNPEMNHDLLIEKLEQSLKGGVNILQVWNNWPGTFARDEKIELIHEVKNLADVYRVPVMINEEWELLEETALDGVHFDILPDNMQLIKSRIERDFIYGITCSNNLSVIRTAEKEGADYISFCSMFPSASVSSCDIVTPRNVRKARELTRLPLFASGGITPENLKELSDLPLDGIAVISGILNSENPKKTTRCYKEILNQTGIES